MSRGLPYDSDGGRDYAAGADGADDRRGLRAVGADRARPRRAVLRLREEPRAVPARDAQASRRDARRQRAQRAVRSLQRGARQSWDDAVELGEQFGYRNAQATVLAPTGTIGFMMDCDTTGVEPDIALVKYKKLVGGGLMKIVNQTVPMALRKLGYTPRRSTRSSTTSTRTRRSKARRRCKESHLPVFDCAFKAAKGQRSIHYMGHIKMMGATQPFISGAISKTVNVPKEATVDEIMQAYIQSWKLGAKAISIYRDGSKRTQPLNTSKDKTAGRDVGAARRPPQLVHAAGPPQAAGRAPGDHAQVRHRRPRGLHHRRPVRGRPAGRDLPGDGEGRLDDLRASPTRSRRRSPTRCSTACRSRRWSTSSATCGSSRRA